MKRVLALLLLALVACESGPAGPGDPTSPIPAPPLREATLLRHLGLLADDSMGGRLAGSPDEGEAALYLLLEFMAYGLGPGTPGYTQEFPLPQGGTSRNVLAVLPGHGSLAQQWVIIGAHYDHVGYDQVTPDSILVYNGADDNASGTALLLEIARYLSDHVEGGNMAGVARRSVMFQTFGAEESGLVGSTYFCGHPTISMHRVVAMLNLDMVGRYAQNGLRLIGTSSSADWPGILDNVGANNLSVDYDDGGLLGGSDQYCFHQAGKPVLFFHTGLHNEYHTAYDDVVLIDTDGMLTVGELTTDVVLQLLVRPAPPIFSATP
ncbi:MAG: M28 family peptidase [Gemmatimonadales bacterium]|nr:M28 family peptidase [Gemmatimonadales bacterium]